MPRIPQNPALHGEACRTQKIDSAAGRQYLDHVQSCALSDLEPVMKLKATFSPFSRSRSNSYIAATIAVLTLCWLDQASSQESIPDDTLQKLKGGTVFVRVDMGAESGTGSGFLIDKKGEFAYLVTNEHVVRQRGRVKRSVYVDFFSGTRKKKSLQATVLSEDRSRDLAVLRIENDDLPTPISLKSSTKIRETQAVYILGFPFGEALATNRLGPNITIGRGTISSIRMDDYGEVERVQVDGDINPGNSGGPIVFSDGTLMGVSVATVIGTQIGLGIPGESVIDMLSGRIGALGISQNSESPKKVTCVLNAELIDPMGRLRSISFFYIDASKVSKKDLLPNEEGQWKKISDRMTQVRLVVDGQRATGKTTIRGDYGEHIDIIHQIKFVNGRGETFFTSPNEYVVNIPERVVKNKRDVEPPRKGDAEIANNEKMDAGRSDADKNIDEDAAREETPDDGKKDSKGWLGNEKNSGKSKTLPKTLNASVLSEEFRCLDAKCQQLNFDTTKVVSKLLWDSQHQHFMVLDKSGVLKKISFPELIEVATIDFESECTWIGMSKQGLCVLNSGLQQLHVLDPETLQPKTKIPVGETTRFAVSPTSSNAYLSARGHLLLMSLISGKHLHEFTGDDFLGENGRPLVREFNSPTITPDGKYLFCVDSGCLTRFRIKGRRLTFEEKGPYLGGNTKDVLISADSQYICLPAGGGNSRGYKTHVFAVDELTTPVIEAQGGAYPQAIGYDKVAGVLYGQNHGAELIVFDGKGLVRRSYDFGRKRPSNTTQLLVHPDGHKVIAVTSPNIVVIHLPED